MRRLVAPCILLALLVAHGASAHASPPMTPLPEPRWGHAAAAVDDAVFVLGGRGPEPSADVLRIDALSGEITPLGAILPEPRWNASAVVMEEKILLLGGRTCGGACGDERDVADVLAYDPTTGGVSVVATLPSPRSETAAVAEGGSVLVVGGRQGDEVLDEVVRVEVASGASTLLARLPEGRAGAAAVFFEGSLFVIGGRTADGSSPPGIVAVRLAEGAVSEVGETAVGRKWGMATAWDGEFLYLFGGDDGRGPTGDIAAFVPYSQRAYRLEASFSEARSAAAAATASNGLQVIVGGVGQGPLPDVKAVHAREFSLLDDEAPSRAPPAPAPVHEEAPPSVPPGREEPAREETPTTPTTAPSRAETPGTPVALVVMAGVAAGAAWRRRAPGR